MKKFIVFSVFIVAIIFVACGSNQNDLKPNTDITPTVSSDLSNNPDYQKGLKLIGQNDCLTCHQINQSGTGPSFEDVANKYANTDANVKMLAEKVIHGGSGNWGTVPMAAHADLSPDDAKAMVKYILLLKTK